MNQLRLEESVCQVLAKCRERGDSSITRDLIHSVLNNNAQESLDVLSILVRELWVFVLHQETDATIDHDSAQSTPKGKHPPQSPSTDSMKISPKMESKPSSDAKPSMLGSVQLPTKRDIGDYDDEASASDVPSHSSASSEDEENEDKYAEEMWKKTLSNQDPKFQTHRDFFETLVKDVEGEHQGLDPNVKNTNVDEANNNDDDLALDERIFVAISASVALAEQTQLERNIEDGEDDELILSSAMISDIAMNTALQMELEDIQAMRCAEDIEDCLCFLFGQPLNSDNKNYLIQTVQKLMLDRAEYLQIGQWYNPADEEDDDDTYDGIDQIAEQLAVEDTASTPEKSANRSKTYEDTGAADEFPKSTSKSNPVVHQTPARTPHNIITPGKSTASKRAKINYDQLDPDLPAWKIPKSPLDSIFRTGYGGIGQSQLKEVIALVEEDSEDEENSDNEENVDHMRLHHTSMDQISLADDSSHSDSDDHDPIDLNDLPPDFGKDQLPQHQGRVIARNSMTKSHNGELSEVNEQVPHPQDHPSTSLHYDHGGKVKLTKSATLNAMLVDSYKGLINQYASHPKHSHHLPIVAHHEGAHYDYDETTVGTSMDSEGYKRMLKQAKRAAAPAPAKSPSASPKKRVLTSSLSPKNPTHVADGKGKKPIVSLVVKTKQHTPKEKNATDLSETNRGLLSLSFEGKNDSNLMLESPNTSVSLPKKAKKEPKVASSKKKRASTGSHPGAHSALTKSSSTLQESHVTDEQHKKKRPSSAKKIVRVSSGGRLLEPTEAMKSRNDAKGQPATNLGGRWKS